MKIDPEEVERCRTRLMSILANCKGIGDFIEILAVAAAAMRVKIADMKRRLDNQAEEIRALKRSARSKG